MLLDILFTWFILSSNSSICHSTLGFALSQIQFNIDKKEQHDQLYRDPVKILHYMDYSANPVADNSKYVPDLVPGMLQPLEINEIMEDDPTLDDMLKNLDIKLIIKSAEELHWVFHLKWIRILEDLESLQVQKQWVILVGGNLLLQEESNVGRKDIWAIEVHLQLQEQTFKSTGQYHWWDTFDNGDPCSIWCFVQLLHGDMQAKWRGISKRDTVWDSPVITTFHEYEW